MYVIDDTNGAYFIAEGNPLVTGRWGGCDIILTSPHASRVHAIFWRIGDFVYMRVLGSELGVNLNGRVVYQARLVAGDILDIDGQKLTFKRSLPAGCEERPVKMEVLASDLELAHHDTELDDIHQMTGKFYYLSPMMLFKMFYDEQVTGKLNLWTEDFGEISIIWVKGEMFYGEPEEFFSADFIEKLISLSELRFQFEQQANFKMPSRNIHQQTAVLLQLEPVERPAAAPLHEKEKEREKEKGKLPVKIPPSQHIDAGSIPQPPPTMPIERT
uniref:FHA domain-containing protein n=1 Tax=Anaerolinea thermolimosa TaxID=229919 RepID=A0A7C4KJ45_9CHLR